MSNQLEVTTQLLTSAKHPQKIISLEEVRGKWIKNYHAVAGRNDGDLKYEAEKNAVIKALEANPKLKEAEPFSFYCALIDIAASESTLRDGHGYLVPFQKRDKTMVVFIPGWRDRLEKINRQPDVLRAHEPQVVYNCDLFEYEKGESVKIHVHKPAANRPSDAIITHVYFVVEFLKGKLVYLMDREEVHSIRDRYSVSYKYYAKNGGKGQSKSGSSYDIEPPMWVTDEAQAFKKTIIKRAYNYIPKSDKQKKIDEYITSKIPSEHIEEETGWVEPTYVDTETGEIIEKTEEKNESY